MKAIGIIFTVVLILVGGSIWQGYVLAVLWGWFFVPAFGLPPLSTAAAIGISLTVALSRAKIDAKPPKKDERPIGERLAEMLSFVAVMPAWALLGGWIVKAFL